MRHITDNFRMQLAGITLLIIVVIIVLEVYLPGSTQGVVLNEVCCYNDTIVYDNIGNYSDYIELYNPADWTIDISGYYISDDKDNLGKYIFPENTFLKSKEYILMWAEDGAEGIWTSEDSSYLGFSLKAGETVYLSDSAGNVIDKVKIPKEIIRDVSYSRISLTSDLWETVSASPGADNPKEMQAPVQLLDVSVNFSVSSGYYSEPFWLKLTTDGEYDIYYTLDGSEPTINSFKYQQPIRIEDRSDMPNQYANIREISLLDTIYLPDYPVAKTNVIRAVAIDDAGVKSKESNATYFIGFDEKYGFENITTISLITDPENMFGYENGIYVSGRVWDLNKEKAYESIYTSPANYTREGAGWQRKVYMQYFNPLKKLVYSQAIGLRIHGGWSTTGNQKSFNMIAMPEIDGNSYVCEGMFGQKERSLILRAGGVRDIAATKMRDVLNQELVAGRNIGIQAYEPCQVFLDGEYWGFYNLQERLDKSYIASHYSVKEDNVVLLKTNKVVNGKDTDLQFYTDVVDFALNHDLSQNRYYSRIQQMIDIQSYIDYYCFEIYVANVDSLGNNFARWRVKDVKNDAYSDGRWRWILYDTDDSTGIIEGRNTADIDSFKEGNWGYNALGDELFAALLQNEGFKEQFVKTFMDMANYNFSAEKALSRLDELSNLYCEAIVTSHRRFLNENYSEDDYIKEMAVVRDFYENRYQYITAYLKTDFSLEGRLFDVVIEKADVSGGASQLNTLIIDGNEKFAGKYYSDYDICLSADTYDGYEFAGWKIGDEIMPESDITLKLDKNYIIKPIWKEKN